MMGSLNASDMTSLHTRRGAPQRVRRPATRRDPGFKRTVSVCLAMCPSRHSSEYVVYACLVAAREATLDNDDQRAHAALQPKVQSARHSDAFVQACFACVVCVAIVLYPSCGERIKSMRFGLLHASHVHG